MAFTETSGETRTATVEAQTATQESLFIRAVKMGAKVLVAAGAFGMAMGSANTASAEAQSGVHMSKPKIAFHTGWDENGCLIDYQTLGNTIIYEQEMALCLQLDEQDTDIRGGKDGTYYYVIDRNDPDGGSPMTFVTIGSYDYWRFNEENIWYRESLKTGSEQIMLTKSGYPSLADGSDGKYESLKKWSKKHILVNALHEVNQANVVKGLLALEQTPAGPPPPIQTPQLTTTQQAKEQAQQTAQQQANENQQQTIQTEQQNIQTYQSANRTASSAFLDEEYAYMNASAQVEDSIFTLPDEYVGVDYDDQ